MKWNLEKYRMLINEIFIERPWEKPGQTTERTNSWEKIAKFLNGYKEFSVTARSVRKDLGIFEKSTEEKTEMKRGHQVSVLIIQSTMTTWRN